VTRSSDRNGDIPAALAASDGREIVALLFRRRDDHYLDEMADPGDDLPPPAVDDLLNDYVLDADQARREEGAAFFLRPPVETGCSGFIQSMSPSVRRALRDIVPRLELAI